MLRHIHSIIFLLFTVFSWLASKKTYNLSKSIVSNGPTSKNMVSIFRQFHAIFQTQDLLKFNWLYIKKTLDKYWSHKIFSLVLCSFLYTFAPTLVAQLQLGSALPIQHDISILLFLQIFAYAVLFIIIIYSNRSIVYLENYVFYTNSKREFSKEEVQYLISRLSYAQSSFEKGNEASQNVVQELSKLAKHVENNVNLLNKSTHLLEKIAKYIIKTNEQ
ncbi:MAG: hypothetical protein H6845_02730 [Alphaproteobacteria bacterium]|nr:MAG: hypothetical protein H6845_02730 [Alphaproteobacteria bacterium]